MFKKIGKKGAFSLDTAPQLVMSFVFVAALAVIGFIIVTSLGTSTTNTDATAAVSNITLGMKNLVSYAPIWGTVAGVSILLGIVLAGLYYFGRRNDGQ